MRTSILVCVILLLSTSGHAACPTADLSGDCYVGLADLALIAIQWEGEPNMPLLYDMASQWMTAGIRDIVFVDIPSGTFQMGDSFDPEGYPDELPVHTVTLSSFKMSKYEITNQQYCDYLNSAYPAQIKVVSGRVYAADNTGNTSLYCNTSISSSHSQIIFSDPNFTVNIKDGTTDMSDHPMVMVSWYGCVAYCNWKSQQEGLESCYDISTWQCDFTKNGIRLPTEAQWEYAARGGNHSPYYRYPWGDSIDGSMANYGASGDPYETGISPHTTPVGYYDGNQIPAGTDMANGYGLYDMAGNVLERCNDWYNESYYSISPTDNPTGPASGSCPVLRGGEWIHHGVSCRIAGRACGAPYDGLPNAGFRICVSASSLD